MSISLTNINKNEYFDIFIRNIISANNYLELQKKRNSYRLIRCNQCINCKQKKDCLKCKNCLNKISLGGNGKRKQGCILKKCLRPTKTYYY